MTVLTLVSFFASLFHAPRGSNIESKQNQLTVYNCLPEIGGIMLCREQKALTPFLGLVSVDTVTVYIRVVKEENQFEITVFPSSGHFLTLFTLTFSFQRRKNRKLL